MLTLAAVKAKSAGKIATLQEPLRTAAGLFVEMCYRRGVWVVITEALRTYDYQNYLYSKGRTRAELDAAGLKHVPALPGADRVTKAKGGYSNHNWGYAFDFALLLRNGRSISWDTLRDDDKDSLPDWDEAVIEGKKLGLEWGGDWRSFVDLPHFQWVQGLDTADFRAGRRPAAAAVTAAVAKMRQIAAETLPVPVVETAPLVFNYYSGTEKKGQAFQYGTEKPIMYVPLKDLAADIGVKFEWDNEKKKAIFNGRPIQDFKNIEGRIYGQLRPIAEGYGKKVVYDKANKKTGVA